MFETEFFLGHFNFPEEVLRRYLIDLRVFYDHLIFCNMVMWDGKKLYAISPLFEILCERLQLISLQHIISNGPHIWIFLEEDNFVSNILNQLLILLHSMPILVHVIRNPFFPLCFISKQEVIM